MRISARNRLKGKVVEGREAHAVVKASDTMVAVED